jgi:nucleoside 2-deoxyribosyltransferase
LVIEPKLQANGFYVERADELADAGPVNEHIINAIFKAKLLLADLTGEKPNSYYEIGLAHALGKSVIILAQSGTTRHFDRPGYQWHYWNSAEEFEPRFEKILLGALIESGYVF